MKRIGKLLALFALVLMFASCNMNRMIQVAKYTSVENLYKLELGSSLQTVITQMGSNPYNILSNQAEGFTIYSYKYKLVERMVKPALANEIGGENRGSEVYNKAEQTVYLFFKSDKLEALVTTEGKKDSSSLIMLNNTLYSFTKNKDKFILAPVTETPNVQPSEEGNLFSKLKK